MNYNELVDEVLSIVKRPDLMSRIQAAVRAATLKAHKQDFFFRDLVETGVQFPNPEFVQNFLPSDIFGTNFRKIKYVRFWNFDSTDSNLGLPGDFLKPIDIENSTDQYGYMKTNVYYMAGQLLQIRTSQPLTHCLTGAYINPMIATPETYSSWIADQFPYAIVYEACRQIFNQVGKASDSRDMLANVVEEYSQLKLDSVNKPGE